MTTNDSLKVAVLGAGAVGGYFGGMLARAGVPVVLIGRPVFAEAVNHHGLSLDTLTFQETVRPQASTELCAAAGADVVLFCVKTMDTASSAKQLAPLLSPGAIVVSLQNGVNNAEEILEASGLNALAAVVYVAASMPAPGLVKHLGRGDLVLSVKDARAAKIAKLFESAGVPCRLSDNIEGELWTKLVANCGLNAISALGNVTYGEIAASQDARRVVEAVVRETVEVARAKGVHATLLDDPAAAVAGTLKIAEQMSATRSSTAQDMARGKPTEIDALNGYVARLGRQLGVPTPVNRALYTLVKLRELALPPKT